MVFVVGEDLESSEEEFDRSESLSLASQKNNQKSITSENVIVQGEAPESDEDAGNVVIIYYAQTF